MPINWYPGHMSKTIRQLTEKVSQVDAVLEVVDARLPLSSRNPEIFCVFQKKPLILVLNKCDLADHDVTVKWIDYFKQNGVKTACISALSGFGFGELKSVVLQSVNGRVQLNRKRGMTGRAVKLMVVGIPNVGKSILINKFTGKKSAAVSNYPGVTRSMQWLNSKDGVFALVDTPGILWPKFEDEVVAEKLAFLGSIKDYVIDCEEIAAKFCHFLSLRYPENIMNRYGVSCDDILNGVSESEIGNKLLCAVARRRGFILRDNQLDLERASNVILTEFRAGKIGRISLETP